MIAIAAAGRSASGRVRENNEDSLASVSPEDPTVLDRKGHLLAIADGLGGHAAGQVASATAIAGLVGAYYAPTSPARVEPALQHAVQAANLKVHHAAQGDPSYRSMQTTLSCLAIVGASAYLAHVGDSRIYRLRGDTLTQLTSDHSEAAELIRLRLARPESLAEHPRRNVLTRTLGSQLLLRPDFRREPVQADDCFVLCTDGLWSEVSNDEIGRIVGTSPPDAACEQLIELQLGRASLDNATVQVVKVVSLERESVVTAGEAGNWLNGLLGHFRSPTSR
ncbi:MAG: PP2C family protein-serine/threonine phosphatase [Chloroflexota bacterium]